MPEHNFRLLMQTVFTALFAGYFVSLLPLRSAPDLKLCKPHHIHLILIGRVVICGAGIIGSSIAYYLSLKGVRSLLVERSGVACAASGKAFVHQLILKT